MDEMILYESELAIRQAKSMIEIENEYTLKLHGESVGVLFAVLVGFVSKAASLLLKILLGSKIALVAVLSFIVYKAFKNVAKSLLTDIYGKGSGGCGGGGSSSSYVPLNKVGTASSIVSKSSLEKMIPKIRNSMKKYGKLRDGSLSLELTNRLKNLIEENTEKISDEKALEISKMAVGNLRVSVDKTSKSAFTISEMTEGVALDMVRANIENDIAFDGTKYSDILKATPFVTFDDIGKIEKLSKVISDETNGKVDGFGGLCADFLKNADNIMSLCVIMQLSASMMMSAMSELEGKDFDALGDDEARINKYVSEHFSKVLDKLMSTEYKEILESLSNNNYGKIVKMFREAYKAGGKNGDIVDTILRDMTYIADESDVIRNTKDGFLGKIEDDINSIKFKEIKNMSDLKLQFKKVTVADNYVLYDIIRYSDISENVEGVFASTIKKIIDDNRLDIATIKENLDRIIENGKKVKDKFETFSKSLDLGGEGEGIKKSISASISLATMEYRIIDISMKIIKSLNHPIFRKIQEDISTAIQGIYMMQVMTQ